MRNFTIDYNTGVSQQVQSSSLEDVRQVALEGITYTQENVTIKQDNEVVSVARWYGVEPGEDDSVLTQIGEYGFYSDWEDQ